MLTLAEADAELQRLTLIKKHHLDEQYVARRSVRDLPGTIASLSERLANLTADQATAAAHATDPLTIGSRPCLRDDALGVLGSHLNAMPRNIRETRRVPLGLYRGLHFGLVLHPQFPTDEYLEGVAGHGAALDTTTPGGKLVFGIFAALAEFERALIVERTQAGLAAARARGRAGGPPYKMTAATAGATAPAAGTICSNKIRMHNHIIGAKLIDLRRRHSPAGR